MGKRDFTSFGASDIRCSSVTNVNHAGEPDTLTAVSA